MGLINDLEARAYDAKKCIVLPEGSEKRIVKAAQIVAEKGLARVVLLAKESELADSAEQLSKSGINIIDTENSDKIETYAKKYYELRKCKGVTYEEAMDTVKKPLYYACMMIKEGEADGMVAGAANTTAGVLRPAFQIIKTSPCTSVVSSCFIMILKDKNFGQDGILVFADCAVNPSPDAQQLAHIAMTTARTAKKLAGIEPRIAMLSFSTKGSACCEAAEKIACAASLAKQLDSSLCIDGELQADAALIESVAKLKAPQSPVAGKANILIFPDLASGNIGYKLVQRLAGAQAIGPICQGLSAPVNDLSRGCSVDDIVSVVTITAVQAI
ncbi:MAG: phosphate acetyltransferase [Christensenellales bacterium]